jgi:hypothetical protein
MTPGLGKLPGQPFLQISAVIECGERINGGKPLQRDRLSLQLGCLRLEFLILLMKENVRIFEG